MIRFTNKLGWVRATVATASLAVAAIGCGSEPGAGAGGTSSDLLMTESLGTIEGTAWLGATAGCEGHLEGDESFAIASADAGLVAAVEADGSIVCVDTVEAVEEELQETGHEEEAAELVDAFFATLAQISRDSDRSRFQSPDREGDPDPEPNIDVNRFRYAGDPDPEPNMGS